VSALRLALLTEIPAPYRLPLFRALAREEAIDLRVWFLAERDPRRGYPPLGREAGFAWSILPSRSVVRAGRWLVLSRGVLGALRRFRPDVVIVGGWSQPAFWQALGYARLARKPVVTWVESTGSESRGGSGAGGPLRRAFVRGSAAFLVPGSASAAYLRSLGVEDGRIAVAANAVDIGRFGHPRCQAPGVGSNGQVRVLYVGRLSREKGLDVLLESVASLPVEVYAVGSGPEQARLEASAPANVTFLGQLDQDAVAAEYARADVFVLPSLAEPWGMVLNEAAAAGLPLVATDAAGAAHELIEDGVNGFRVRAGDAQALHDALRRLAEDASFRRRAGERSRELAQRFTPEAWAAAVAALARRLG
jgi:glycosyltransferase involved in cell wall biosynthesis